MTTGVFPKIAAAAMAAFVAGAVAGAMGPALAQGLPEGKGKALIEMACTECHDVSRITEGAFSRAEWDMVVRSMAEMGANIRREDIPVLVDYLAASFPPKTNK
jgi:cytochrome c5